MLKRKIKGDNKMNTLLQNAVSTWETHNKNNVASALIVDGLVAVKQEKNNTASPDTVEIKPFENLKKSSKTDNVLPSLFESLSRTLKASA